MTHRNKILILIAAAIASWTLGAGLVVIAFWALGIGLVVIACFVFPVVTSIALFAACIAFCIYDLCSAFDPVDAE